MGGEEARSHMKIFQPSQPLRPQPSAPHATTPLSSPSGEDASSAAIDHIAAVATLQAEEDEIFGRVRIPIYPFICFLIFCFILVEIPFSKPKIPQAIMIATGFFSAVVIVFLALESIFLVILLLTAFIPYSNLLPGTFGGFMMAFNLTNIITIVIVFGWFARGAIHRERMFFSNRGNLVILVYMLIAVNSIINGYIYAESGFDLVIRLKRYLTPILFFYIFASNIRAPKQVQYVLDTLCIATAGAAVMTVKEAVLDIGTMGSWEKMRVCGITGQPNDLAAFFSYFTPVILALFLLKIRNRRYWLLLIPIALCGYSVIRTFSRGGSISFAVAMLATLFFWRKKWAAVALVFILGVCVLFPESVPESVIGRFRGTFIPTSDPESTFATERLETSASLRLEVWSAALNTIIKIYPLQGVGYGKFIRTIGRDAHNGYILIAAEMGVPALIVFLWMLYLFFRSSLVLSRSKFFVAHWLGLSFLGTLSGLIASNFFGSRLNTQEVSAYFWMMGGMVMMVHRHLENGNPLFMDPESARPFGTDNEPSAGTSSMTDQTKNVSGQNESKGYHSSAFSKEKNSSLRPPPRLR